MIRAEAGEFKLDDHKLVIHPELSLSDFREGDISATAIVPETQHSGVYGFVGTIDGLRARFQIEFGRERLTKLRFAEDVVLYDQKVIDRALAVAQGKGHEAYVVELRKWTDRVSQADGKQKERHDAWLKSVIGRPPYEYTWGEIISEIDPRGGDVEILVRFKYDFGEDADLQAYFENRREQEFSQAVNPPKPMVSGQLPPGFSRKT